MLSDAGPQAPRNRPHHIDGGVLAESRVPSKNQHPMSTLILTDPIFLEHDTGAGHPECRERLDAILGLLRESPVPGTTTRAPRDATIAELARNHPTAHLERIEGLRGQSTSLDADTRVSELSVDAAHRAAGAALDAVDSLMAGHARNAFALVRPPGHHAEPNQAMGFCLYNNVAIAARHAQVAHGLQRVLIVDWDVHHGNGTQRAFYDDPNVAVFNLHQWPLYPGTGALPEVGHGDGKGRNINVPLPAGLGDGEYALAFRALLEPIAEAFRPELILVSAGFDGHRDDPLASMQLTEDGFAGLCASVRQLAETHADGRLALLLEGGYDLTALARSTRACLRILTGESPPPSPPPAREEAILEAVKTHRRNWNL